MYRLETRALSTFTSPPSLWKRYVDDTFAKILEIHVEDFLKHLNSLHPRIKFTTENMIDNKIAFLDTEVHVNSDRSTKIQIYRKPTHTDQYLNFNSNHHISQKLGIIGTFENRINTLITTEEDKNQEKEYMKNAMKLNDYPERSLNRGPPHGGPRPSPTNARPSPTKPDQHWCRARSGLVGLGRAG